MAPQMETMEKLCHDAKTLQEAKKILVIARTSTAVGSGFDLGEARTGLEAVCAYLASQDLNNTNVTIEAAQIASCQTMPKFKKLRDQVVKAVTAARKPARRDPLKYESLLKDHCAQINALRGAKWMHNVEALVMPQLDDEKISEDEITCAVFIWVCHLVTNERLFRANSFEETYDVHTANIRQLSKLIKIVCGPELEAKIREDYSKPASPAKSASASPRKSPSKPALRALPSRDSPQKRKVTFPDADADDLPTPDSPTKRQKVAQPTASSSLVTLESIRQRQTRSMSGSPTKPAPSTPRKPQRLPSSPSKSPVKALAAVTPSRPLKPTPMDVELLSSDSSDEEESAPAPRRRFRPVFRDQKQWAMCDPRLAKLTSAAVEYHKSMTKRHGMPFQDARHSEDVAMDSD
ncbi:hypothetical protein B0H17DRAFT_1176464 [Mycena rosella]|uniref:Uncharacterized protein n=1 Tax=Mycena rosella TaxID=1033263 RepID=A0AAD7DXW2_MYCRO|nr:hypothetical protein B0H17DRAFT_1176464 [Mycena rosella]